MTAITAVYRRTAKGSLSISFAADLVRRLGGNSLNVTAPADPTQESVAMIERQSALIVEDVRSMTGLESVVFTPTPTGGIVVDHGQTAEYEECDTLYPRLESGLFARGSGPIVVPFGDSLEAVPQAERACLLAKQLALPMVLYHTTWVDTGVTSKNPADHMCAAAIQVEQRLTQMAVGHGVEVKSVIETASDVVEGIVHCTMRESARLIVMSRSSKTTLGCYVEQALKQSPVPLLAIAALDRRRP